MVRSEEASVLGLPVPCTSRTSNDTPSTLPKGTMSLALLEAIRDWGRTQRRGSLGICTVTWNAAPGYGVP